MTTDNIRLAFTGLDESLAWFKSLSESQKRELAELDWAWVCSSQVDGPILKGVTKDWIEEHGGDRGWWGSVQTFQDEEIPADETA